MNSSAFAEDGARIAYHRSRASATACPTIALLHSLAMDHSFWKPVVDCLPDNFDVIAIDARGHGQSDKPVGPYTVKIFADDLAAVLSHAEVDQAVVAGASMGGSVSLAFAAHHAERTAGLVLIDTTAHYGVDAMAGWEKRGRTAVDKGLAALIGFQQERWFSDQFRERHPDVVKQSIDVFLANDPDSYLQSCLMLGHCDMRFALDSIEVPTTIVVGEEDYATPIDMARKLNDAIKESELTIINKARHFTAIEKPETVAAAIENVVIRSQSTTH